MGLIRLMKRGGDELYEYKKALKMAKKSIDMLCELTEDMESEYGYGERGYYRRDEERDDEMSERSGMRRRM